MTTIDLEYPTAEIPRDRWGRPLIAPVDGGKPVPYTRVSTLAKALQDTTALTKWKQRQVAIGMGVRSDLPVKAAAVKDNDKELNAIVEEAMSAAESSRAANLGTAIHAMTERIDDGADMIEFPADFHSTLLAYKEAMAGIEILGKEEFVVVDELEAAGTFDRLVQLPDGRTVVADIKTGKDEPNYPHASTIQIATYAHGHLYTVEQGRAGHLPELGVSTDVGLLIHLPAGRGVCDLYLLDLEWGWEMAQVATAVRAALKTKPIQPYTP